MASSMGGKIGSGVAQGVGILGQLLFAGIGAAVANGDYEKARDLYRHAIDNIDQEQIPAFQEMVAQELGPQREVQMQSAGRSAQQGAISKLQGFIDQNGLDAQARSQLQESQSKMGQEMRGQREAIMSHYANSGMGGSGNELLARLQGQSAASNEGRNAALGIAGQARQRALGAIGQQAGIAGQMRGQDIGIETNNVAAERERQAFNAKMRYAAAGANNEGRLNTSMARLKKLAMLNDARSKLAENYEQGANRTRRDWAGVGQGFNAMSQGASDWMDENL